jgi:two-component sensor histidine kinase
MIRAGLPTSVTAGRELARSIPGITREVTLDPSQTSMGNKSSNRDLPLRARLSLVLKAIATGHGACNQVAVNVLRSAYPSIDRKAGDHRALTAGLQGRVRASHDRPFWLKVSLGALAAVFAILVRWSLPLNPQQLPTLTVVIATALVTTFVGVRAGIVTAVLGGLASWYLFFNEYSWSLANAAWVPLLGFAATATTIVCTAALYRESERRSHAKELDAFEKQADNAELFAREMAHRLKNTLAIVQSVAFQTFGNGTSEASLFASRLKALADANELLNEKVEEPEADVFRVVKGALQPFHVSPARLQIECVHANIPSRQVLSLALALHELATNAVKYGALSSTTGRVLLRLEDAGQVLKLTWKEQGGPPVVPPPSEGFGTRLLRRTGANALLNFEADGLRCSLEVRKA